MLKQNEKEGTRKKASNELKRNSHKGSRKNTKIQINFHFNHKHFHLNEQKN
jgi:hypothetical protein